MTQTEPSRMHERLTALETNHKNVLSRIDSVESSVSNLSDKMDKVLEFVQESRVRQLPPFNTIVVTTVATLSLMSMIIGGIFYLVDSRVGAGVQRANFFVSQLADGPNNIFVQLHDHDMRIKRLESPSPKN